MKLYSLTQVGNMAEVGCYGVFSTPEKRPGLPLSSPKVMVKNIQKKPNGTDSPRKSTAVTMNLKFGNTASTNRIKTQFGS